VDLAILVAACAFGATPMAVPAVAPNVMHSLIWEQSRGSHGRSRPPMTTNCASINRSRQALADNLCGGAAHSRPAVLVDGSLPL
jgi:hypothetical protein